MIKSFADAETEHFFAIGKSRRLPPDIFKRAVMRLTQLDSAVDVSGVVDRQIGRNLEHPYQ